MTPTWQSTAVYAGIYLAASAITFLVYAFDKLAARRGTTRIRERTLHLLALLGGWPGALLAQQLLRHKSAKKPFRVVLWLTVILNVALYALLWSPLNELLAALQER